MFPTWGDDAKAPAKHSTTVPSSDLVAMVWIVELKKGLEGPLTMRISNGPQLVGIDDVPSWGIMHPDVSATTHRVTPPSSWVHIRERLPPGHTATILSVAPGTEVRVPTAPEVILLITSQLYMYTNFKFTVHSVAFRWWQRYSTPPPIQCLYVSYSIQSMGFIPLSRMFNIVVLSVKS